MKKRIKAIESHVRVDDYFGTLATLLYLLKQDIIEKDEGNQLLEDLAGDLLYLQENFKIVRRRNK